MDIRLLVYGLPGLGPYLLPEEQERMRQRRSDRRKGQAIRNSEGRGDK